MARPKASQLTERELDIMHVFWEEPARERTIGEVRDTLAAAGRDLAYTTIATFVGILERKKFLEQTTHERPFRYRQRKSADDVSKKMLSDMLRRVFRGSRTALMKCLLGKEKLSAREMAEINELLNEQSR